MAKVYVATRLSGDCSFIDAIFDRRENAELYVARVVETIDNTVCETKIEVREIEVLAAVPKAKLHYYAVLEYSGFLEEQFARWAWSHTPAYTKPSGGWCDRSFAYGLSRKGFDEAMKYASEALTKRLGGD